MGIFNTKLYIEGIEVDLTEDVDMPITYVIDDVRNLSTVKSNFSKTIKIPGSSKNNQIFNFFFDIKSTGGFPKDGSLPNIGYNYTFKRKAKAYVIQDNAVILSGYARLLNSSNTNGKVEYEISIDSELGSFISALGDSKLEDLYYNTSSISASISSYAHTVTKENITSSWSNSPGTSYFYPLIDYGSYDTANGANFFTDNLRPCLYAKQYLDLIFSASGYTYNSDFINSNFFKRLIIPYKDGDILKTSGQVMIGTGISGSALTISSSYGIPVSTNPPTSSYRNVFGKGTPPFVSSSAVGTWSGSSENPPSFGTASSFYPAGQGNYFIEFDLTYNMYIILTAGNVYGRVYSQPITVNTGYQILSSSVVIGQGIVDSTTYPKATFQFEGSAAYFTGLTLNNKKSNISWNYPSGSSYSIRPFMNVTTVASQSALVYSTVFEFVVDQHATASIIVDKGATTPNVRFYKSDIFDGSQATFQTFVPKDVKQIDYVSSIVNLFNLYPVPDKNRPKHFNIYTRDQYYSGSVKKDWTKKIDLNSPITITPIPNLDSKELYFSYKEDSDYWNKQYKSLYGGTYGDLSVTTAYQFSNSSKNVIEKNIFSPTIPIQYDYNTIPSEDTIVVYNAFRNIIFSTGFIENITGSATSISDSAKFKAARIGSQISYWDQIYTITAMNSPTSFILDRPVTRSLGAVDATYYANGDSFTYIQTGSDKIFPAIYDSTDDNKTRKPFKANPRILYYAGTASCARWVLESTPVEYNTPINGTIYRNVTTASLNYYPYCSHVNSITAPTIDLLFGNPKALFFSQTFPYPDLNLYNIFWRNSINEITDDEAKLFTATFRLNSVDIANLSLSDTIHMDGVDYRINQITDYKPDPENLTTVELVRLPFREVVTVDFTAQP